jgi:signal transduction histidine kinase
MITNIRFRLILSHLTVIVLAMALSGVVLLSLIEQYFLQAAHNSLMAQARLTAAAILPDAPTTEDSQPPLANLLQQQAPQNLFLESANVNQLQDGNFQLDPRTDVTLQLGAQLNTHIRILNASGIVLVDSQATAGNTTVGAHLQANRLIQQAQQGLSASDRLEGNTLALALPVMHTDKLVAIVYLRQPLDDMFIVLDDLRSRWLLSTTGGLLLSAVVGLVLSQVIVKPLRRLTAAAEAVAEGDFNQQVSINSRDELGRLSHTFNQMTARLQAARQMQTDFVANVSHELRTPLTSIKTMIETLRDGALDDDEVREPFLEILDSETERLIRLVNDLLLLSRVDSQGLHLRRTTVALDALIQKALSPLMEQYPSRIHIQKTEQMCVSVDADRIAQVFINVTHNALTYSPPHSAVTLTACRQAAAEVLITISDEGIGIPAADLPRIGQRFYRTDSARSRLQGGSGLGLAIARALVEAHTGQLWLSSTEGVGTQVHFTLPLG